MEDGVNVNIKGRLPCFGCEIQQTAVDGTTCGMDENIDVPKLVLHFSHRTKEVFRLSTIGLDQFATAANRANRISNLCGLGINPVSNDSNISAFPGERDCG